MKRDHEVKCNGKNIYESEHEARKVRQLVLKKRKIRLRIYQCGACHGGWHLTSEPKFVRLRGGKGNKKYATTRNFKGKRYETDW